MRSGENQGRGMKINSRKLFRALIQLFTLFLFPSFVNAQADLRNGSFDDLRNMGEIISAVRNSQRHYGTVAETASSNDGKWIKLSKEEKGNYTVIPSSLTSGNIIWWREGAYCNGEDGCTYMYV